MNALPPQPAAQKHTQTTSDIETLPLSMHAWSMREGTSPSTCSTELHAHTHTYIHNTRIQMPCHLCMLGLCVRARPPQPAAQNYMHTHIHTYTVHEYKCLAIYVCLVYARGHCPLNLQHSITCTRTYIHTHYTNTDALPLMHAWSMHEGTAPSTCST